MKRTQTGFSLGARGGWRLGLRQRLDEAEKIREMKERLGTDGCFCTTEDLREARARAETCLVLVQTFPMLRDN